MLYLFSESYAMATTSNSPNLGQPHLVSLVLQSKKALQHGEQLCLRASSLSSTSAQTAVDVLALDAKVKWFTDAVLEQLKVRVLARVVIPRTLTYLVSDDLLRKP